MEPAGGSVDDGSMDLYCYLAPQNSQIHTQMFCNRKLPSFQWQNMPVDFGACKIIRKGLFSKNMGHLKLRPAFKGLEQSSQRSAQSEKGKLIQETKLTWKASPSIRRVQPVERALQPIRYAFSTRLPNLLSRMYLPHTHEE
jgi:hypothetical protein